MRKQQKQKQAPAFSSPLSLRPWCEGLNPPPTPARIGLSCLLLLPSPLLPSPSSFPLLLPPPPPPTSMPTPYVLPSCLARSPTSLAGGGGGWRVEEGLRDQEQQGEGGELHPPPSSSSSSSLLLLQPHTTTATPSNHSTAQQQQRNPLPQSPANLQRQLLPTPTTTTKGFEHNSNTIVIITIGVPFSLSIPFFLFWLSTHSGKQA